MPVDYSGQDLSAHDFSHQDLTSANLTDMDGVKGLDTVTGLVP